jgi:crotonobetainyl-CoA:carnitine CoA-transferase CaiB-like acyl-CoA transferase
MSSGPLAGVRVVDLTAMVMGPYCTQIMADMGADVIKVEPPAGDNTRYISVGPAPGMSGVYVNVNRGKRAVVLDLRTDAGTAALRALIETADVFIHSMRSKAIARLGFGYEDLRKEHPALIYCSLSGFGRTGPYKDRRGFDLVAQAMSGIMSFTGERPDGPPVKCGAPLSDITAGLLAAMGILAAYSHRLKTGEGQRVETSLYEAALVQTYWQSAIALATGVAPHAMGSAHPLNAPYQAFEASDGWIVVGGANQKNWLRLVEALGAPELAGDPRFVTGADRMGHLKELEAELSARFKTKPAQHWLDVLEAKGVPCGPVHDMLQALSDPQTLARKMVVEVDHTTLGPVKTLGLPVKFSGTPGKVRTGAPLYGEHTREVLREYGFNDQQIADLENESAIVSAKSNDRSESEETLTLRRAN